MKKNLKPAKFERSLSIIHAPATIAKLLDIKKDRLIYCIEFYWSHSRQSNCEIHKKLYGYK